MGPKWERVEDPYWALCVRGVMTGHGDEMVGWGVHMRVTPRDFSLGMGHPRAKLALGPLWAGEQGQGGMN